MQPLPKAEVDPWCAALLRDAPPLLRERDSDALGIRAREWAEEQLGRIRDPAFAQVFRKHCPVEGCVDKDYNQRIVDVGDGVQVLVGIRFRGGDQKFPFVDLVASSAPYATCRDAVLAAMREEFAKFSPRALRVIGPETTPQHDGETIDQFFHAAEVETVAASGETNLADAALTLQIVDADGVDASLERMLEAYRQFAEHDPALAELVEPCNRDHLVTCVEQGALADIHVDGRPVGLIGVAEEPDWLFRGYCVFEEVLEREWCGRGIAARAQRLLAARLAKRGSGGLIWGTIHGANLASQKTAERAGRTARAAWRFAAL